MWKRRLVNVKCAEEERVKEDFFAVKSSDGVRVIDQKLTQRGAEVIQACVSEGGSPVDDVIQTASLRHGEVLALIAALDAGLRVHALRIAGVEVGLQAVALGRTKRGVLNPHLLLLCALIQHNVLVLLPVARLGVGRAPLLGRRTSRALGEARVLAAAGLCRGIGLAVRLEGTLRAAHEALASHGGDSEGVVLMDQVLLALRGVIFAGLFGVIQGQHGERTFPCAEANRLAEPLVAFLPHLLISGGLPGSVVGGVDDAGGAGGHGPGVLCPDHAGAVLRRTVPVVHAALRKVSESGFGIGQLAEREGEPGERKLPVEMVVAGGSDPAEHV